MELQAASALCSSVIITDHWQEEPLQKAEGDTALLIIVAHFTACAPVVEAI